MLFGALAGAWRVFADWANAVVARIRPAANVENNAMGFMTCLLFKIPRIQIRAGAHHGCMSCLTQAARERRSPRTRARESVCHNLLRVLSSSGWPLEEKWHILIFLPAEDLIRSND
jgi:hypothetical protein